MLHIDNQEFRIKPYMIIYLIMLIVCYGIQWGLSPKQFNNFILSDINEYNLITHQLMHADPLHLLWNMILIWIFAGAISKCFPYGLVFLAMLSFGIIAGIGHFYLRGTDAVGASGGAYGMIGMTLILYGKNRIIIGEQIRLPVFAIISLLIVANLFFLLINMRDSSQWGHFSSFGGGIIIGIIINFLCRNKCDDYEHPLFTF